MVFGSARTVYVDTRNKSLKERGRTVIIIGIGQDQGYKVYISKDDMVGVIQHVRNIGTIPDDQDRLITINLERIYCG